MIVIIHTSTSNNKTSTDNSSAGMQLPGQSASRPRHLETRPQTLIRTDGSFWAKGVETMPCIADVT